MMPGGLRSIIENLPHRDVAGSPQGTMPSDPRLGQKKRQTEIGIPARGREQRETMQAISAHSPRGHANEPMLSLNFIRLRP